MAMQFASIVLCIILCSVSNVSTINPDKLSEYFLSPLTAAFLSGGLFFGLMAAGSFIGMKRYLKILN
ncbi:MAG TPA: hypothetical protein VF988_04130, partial [Verrucomicrobiae bacterium]